MDGWMKEGRKRKQECTLLAGGGRSSSSLKPSIELSRAIEPSPRDSFAIFLFTDFCFHSCPLFAFTCFSSLSLSSAAATYHEQE